ncbi:hypothetical protein TRFO_06204 [Tritrichomonas foetus]|uniref:Uncharacterized protein n=1 Tax=Tritrichomonas foetus TaxID=1144522 RepID=A0A1J4K016_9EUKA|nr:hypothetical protein TRFO_06204 [Tritrichomonas foetus]|eukprot:OHT04761.1 hypothetical protein TRFO_06204 [Tritrichomonas foetus]
MTDETLKVYSELKAKATALIKQRGPSLLQTSNPPQEPTPVRSEQDRLKELIKKLFADKTQLKNELDKEVSAHNEDISKLTEEYNNLKNEFSTLAENIANKPPEASPEQIEQIEKLNNKIGDIQQTIRKVKNDINEAQISHEVLRKQSEQYKLRVDQLQEDLLSADSNQQDLAKLKTNLSKIDDEIREKSREITQREAAIQWNQHEISKITQQINQLTSHQSTFSIVKSDPIQINQPVFNFDENAHKIYTEIQEIEGNLQNNRKLDDSSLADFILSLPEKIRFYESENQKLMQQSAKYRRNFAKLKGVKVNDESKKGPSPESLKNAAQKLMAINKEKTEAIKKLKSIVTRQHEALQKVIGSPSTNTALSLSMRNVFHQLRTCNRSERKALCAQGVRILDAMLGIRI